MVNIIRVKGWVDAGGFSRDKRAADWMRLPYPAHSGGTGVGGLSKRGGLAYWKTPLAFMQQK